MKGLYRILIFLIFAACATESIKVVDADNPLAGEWKYVDCSIKDTVIKGTITFRSDGTFRLEAVVSDDSPVEKISGIFTYRVSGPMIFTNYDRKYGMSQYFYIAGDDLIFSDVPPEHNRDMRYWRYKLLREK